MKEIPLLFVTLKYIIAYKNEKTDLRFKHVNKSWHEIKRIKLMFVNYNWAQVKSWDYEWWVFR